MKKRRVARQKVGYRAPVASMARQHADLIRELSSGGKKNKGLEVLNIWHVSLNQNQWVDRNPAFKCFLKELANYLLLERYEELDVSNVAEVCKRTNEFSISLNNG